MTFWLLLTVNSVTFGGLLFLLSAGFSLIFGLMRIPNLTHGSMFMVGAYLGTTLLSGALGFTLNFWLAAIIAALEVALLGGLMERLLLRRLAGQPLAQVLVTLGVSFMVADLCLMGWGGDPISVATPPHLAGFVRWGGAALCGSTSTSSAPRSNNHWVWAATSGSAAMTVVPANLEPASQAAPLTPNFGSTREEIRVFMRVASSTSRGC